MIRIAPWSALHPGITVLKVEAEREGFRLLGRFVEE